MIIFDFHYFVAQKFAHVLTAVQNFVVMLSLYLKI